MAVILLYCNVAGSVVLFSDLSAGSREAALVKRVFDGDTILVSIGGVKEKVRLIGIDAPEKNHPLGPIEFFYGEATQFLKGLAEGESVFLEYDWQKRDRYGRLLAYVYLKDGRMVNAEIVKEGYGFAYLKYPFQRSEEFKQYEKQARRMGKGLWRNQGRDEWDWLESMDRKPVLVYEMSGALWGIEYDGFLKLRLNKKELISSLSRLRLWIHAYREEDLKDKLKENGWLEKKRSR